MATFIARTSVHEASGTHSTLRVAVKDLIDVAGLPTTNGSKILGPTAASDGPVGHDAGCMAGTRAAEAAGTTVIVGKANMHELAFGVTGINPWYGTPINPLDARLIPGGSSSGSAAAVGAGEADLAFGSDTGGSIRIPAACCGVVGLKTTHGRIPLSGVRPLAPSLDTVGPMAATVALAAAGMALLEPGFVVGREPARTIGRLRLPCSPHIEAALDGAIAAMASSCGSVVRDVELRGWGTATDAASLILAGEAWDTHSDLWFDHRDRLSRDVADRLEAASSLRPGEMEQALLWKRAWSEELTEVFASVDVIALPTLAADPPDLAHGSDMMKIRRTLPFNLSGHPALSMPVHTSGPARTPASLQLVAPERGEELLLATAAVIETVAGSPIR